MIMGMVLTGSSGIIADDGVGMIWIKMVDPKGDVLGLSHLGTSDEVWAWCS